MGPAAAEAAPAGHGAGHRQSPETVIWAAKHRYPYVVLGSSLDQTKELIELYRETAAEERLRDGPAAHRLSHPRASSPTPNEKAQEQGYNFFWQNGALNKQIREWMAPPGYATVDVAGIRRLRAVSKAFDNQAYQEAQDNYQLDPRHARPGGRGEAALTCATLLGVGHMCMWSHDGYMTHEDTVRCIELMGKEVLPALRAS